MGANSAEKRAARRYQAEHPGVTYPGALREVRRLHRLQREAEAAQEAADDRLTVEAILRGAVDGDDQLVGYELSVDHSGAAFDVDLGPEIEEGPVDVDSVDIDINSLWFDEHERYEGDTILGEVHVTASISYSACVYKSTYYGAPEDVAWDLIDADWNDHYVRVAGDFTGELVYHFVINEGEDRTDGLTLVELIQLDKGPALAVADGLITQENASGDPRIDEASGDKGQG